MASITKELGVIKARGKFAMKETRKVCDLPSIATVQDQVRRQIAHVRKYRISVLKTVGVFSSLSREELESAADWMDERYYKKGEYVIRQDDIGDAFFILEEGEIVVTRKQNTSDPNEQPMTLRVLGKDSYFGEISLLTEEVRSANIIVITETAKCLRMTKANFNGILQCAQLANEALRKNIGQRVVKTVPIFKKLSPANLQHLLNSMVPITFPPDSYICRQGSNGNTFYIITAGSCRVTLNSDVSGEEREISTLNVGDFFGEVALIDASAKRTANVIANTAVVCMSLQRNDFKVILKQIRVMLMEHQALKHHNMVVKSDEILAKRALIKKNNNRRRISSIGPDLQKCKERTATIIKRLCKSMSECLRLSMYARLYLSISLSHALQAQSGLHGKSILQKCDTRDQAVEKLTELCRFILLIPGMERKVSDNDLINTLLSTKNDLKDVYCLNWHSFQLNELGKISQFKREYALRKIYDSGARGTCAYLILRGCVRLFTPQSDPVTGKQVLRLEQDCFPGEVIGGDALNGAQCRTDTAIAMTAVDLLVIEYEGFKMAHHEVKAVQLTVDEKYHFLRNIPMFKKWEGFSLLKVAHALVQKEFRKGSTIVAKGSIPDCLYFTLSGRLSVVASSTRMEPIISIMKYDYLGEAGIINHFFRNLYGNTNHRFPIVANTHVELLLLPEDNYSAVFTADQVDEIRRIYIERRQYRFDRRSETIEERHRVHKIQHDLKIEQKELSEQGMLDESAPRSREASPPRAHSPVGLSMGDSALIAGEENDNASVGGISMKSSWETGTLRTLQTSRSLSNMSHAPSILSRDSSFQGGGSGSIGGQHQLKTLDDIPSFVSGGLDPNLIMATCRNGKERKDMSSKLALLSLQPAARVRLGNLVGVKNIHAIPESLQGMKRILCDSCLSVEKVASDGTLVSSHKFDRFGVEADRELWKKMQKTKKSGYLDDISLVTDPTGIPQPGMAGALSDSDSEIEEISTSGLPRVRNNERRYAFAFKGDDMNKAKRLDKKAK